MINVELLHVTDVSIQPWTTCMKSLLVRKVWMAVRMRRFEQNEQNAFTVSQLCTAISQDLTIKNNILPRWIPNCVKLSQMLNWTDVKSHKNSDILECHIANYWICSKFQQHTWKCLKMKIKWPYLMWLCCSYCHENTNLSHKMIWFGHLGLQCEYSLRWWYLFEWVMIYEASIAYYCKIVRAYPKGSSY